MTVVENLPHNTTIPPKEKVDKTFFDTDFFSDTNIQFLLTEYGPVGPLGYLRIALAILAEGGSIHNRVAKSFLKNLGANDDLLQCIIDIKLLYLCGDEIRSARADREILALATKRNNWRQKKHNYRHKGESPECPSRHSVDSEEEEEKEKEYEQELEKEAGTGRATSRSDSNDSNGLRAPAGQTANGGGEELCRGPSKKRNRSPIDVSSITYPVEFNTEECRFQWQRWLTHKAAKGKPYKTLDSMEAKLRSLAKELKTPERFIAAIEHSVGENYEGVFEKPAQRQLGGFGAVGKAEQRTQANDKALLDFLEEKNGQ